MNKGQIQLPDTELFETEEDARKAFNQGKTSWFRGSEALILKTHVIDGDRICRGHQTVTVLDVHSISPNGCPVYAVRTDDGQVIQVKAQELLTERELFYKSDGSPSDYWVWMQGRIEKQKSVEAAMRKRRERRIKRGDRKIPKIPVRVRFC